MPNSSSCIDLIFTSQPDMVIESGVHFSLHSSCHHEIDLAKFNLKICYPPPYPRELWHFKEAKADLIRRALNDFNRERAFSNTNFNEKVCIFNTSVLNVLKVRLPFKKTCPCTILPPPFLNFSDFPPPGKVFKIYSPPPFKKGGGPNYGDT